MSKFKNKYRIESARLQSWDYSSPWWYYVTINTKNHIEWFGKIKNGKMFLNRFGEIVEDYWTVIPNHFNNVELDYYVIMPNHIHGILILNECRRGVEPRLTELKFNVSTNRDKNNYFSIISPKSNSLSSIIRSYKGSVRRWAHKNSLDGFQWQRLFYDRIIRDEKEWFRIRKYIEHIPLKWAMEKTADNLDY